MARYSTLSARPGARLLALAGGVAQLSWGGLDLAIVLAVTAGGRSLAAAGLAVGALSLAAAALAPLRGRLVDRYGSGALLPLALTSSVALLTLAVVSGGSAPTVALMALAGLGGAAAPPVMALARSIWPVVAGPELRRAGHAVNAMLGDLGAALGPALAGVLAALLGAGAALALFAVLPLAGCLLIAAGGLASRRQAACASRRHSGARPPTGPGLRTIALSAAAVAVSLGAIQICAPAIARQGGHVELAALPLAAFATTSFAATLLLGRGRGRPATQLFLRGCGYLAGALALCAVATSLLPFTLVLLAAGAGFGTFNLALFELLDDVVPAERGTEALTWITSAEGAGLAAGSALAGVLADSSVQLALLVVALAPVLGAVLAWSGRAALEPQGPSTREAYSLANVRPGSSSSRAAAKSSQRG